MKCNVSHLYTRLLHTVQKLRGEVQPRRGCRRRAVDLGVHRLVSLLILQLLLDIGRQGHFAETLQHLKEYPLIGEPHQAVAAG